MTDVRHIITWWFLFLITGVASLPLCWIVFKKFTDIGYGLAKTIGLLTITYISFILATFKITSLTTSNLYLIFCSYALTNFFLYSKFKNQIDKSVKKNLKVMVAQEILFTLGFLLWTTVRGHQSDINGLEKFMDFGFINSILRSKFLPPPDMWFTGRSINYYWFGHLLVAIATKLSQIPSSTTYNLMLATILGLGLTSAFSIVTTLVKNTNINNRRIWYAAGIISALLLVFAGNFHTPVYLLKNGVQKYWYPDATRFIGYNPETEDKTIHEFPIYSFVVSDLHAHLINLPLVILFIALLLKTTLPRKYPGLKELIPHGFVLGVMFMTNAWDFANYGLATGFVFLLLNLKSKGVNLYALFKTALSSITIAAIGVITTLPFLLNFDSLAKGISFVNARTPLWQLAVLWGFPALLSVIFILVVKKPLSKIKKPDIFVLALLITSWTLIILPEIIYVKDIYIASHHRANTMFKLTYQAFVMSYLSSGYIAARSLLLIKKINFRLPLAIFFTLIFTSIMYYPYIATKTYYRDLEKYQGLNGETWLLQKHPDIYNTIVWIRKNIDDQPTILEAPGDSYTEFNVISSYTGLPTVSGWFVHEWLWRGEAKFPQERVTDITQIYTSNDLNLTKLLLNKYEVEYVILGEFERQKFPNLNETKFSQLGTRVFSSGKTSVYKLN